MNRGTYTGTIAEVAGFTGLVSEEEEGIVRVKFDNSVNGFLNDQWYAFPAADFEITETDVPYEPPPWNGIGEEP